MWCEMGKYSQHEIANRACFVLRFVWVCVQDAVMKDILSNAHQLSHDQYGNYVIQHVLEHGAPVDRATVAGILTPHATSLSTHKFASNVVEKALVHCAYKERDALIKAIIGPEPEIPLGSVDGTSTPDGLGEPNGATPGPVDKLQSMMHDQYGNYVVQKVSHTQHYPRHLSTTVTSQRQLVSRVDRHPRSWLFRYFSLGCKRVCFLACV